MKKRAILLIILLLCGLLLWWKMVGGKLGGSDGMAGGVVSRDFVAEARTAQNNTAFPAKASARNGATGKATHSPRRLKQFYLPQVNIFGLTLEAALQNLEAAYRATCLETGETPLDLTFVVPPGRNKPLRIFLRVHNLDGAIHQLAAMAGLKVTRKGSEYSFEAPVETGKPIKKTLQTSPMFLMMLGGKEAHGEWTQPTFDLGKYIATMGLDLDPSTRLTYSNNDQTITIEGSSAADELAVSGFVPLIDKPEVTRHKIETKIFEIAATADWTPLEQAQFDGDQMQFIRLVILEDAKVLFAPATVSQGGQAAKIQVVQELITPTDDSGTNFETNLLGHQIDLTTVPLGFGHRTDLNYSHTTGGADPVTGHAVVDRQEIRNAEFTGEGATRLVVGSRPDGSHTAVLITPTLMNPAGEGDSFTSQ